MKKIFVLFILQFFVLSVLACKDKNEKIFTPGLAWDSKIIASSWQEAVDYCEKKKMFLPTKNELVSGFNSKQKVLKLSKNNYWSSSIDENPSHAWVVNFANGNVFKYNKNYSYYARCVLR